jgi:hypothetical protein
MPENRLAADLDHGLRLEVGLLGDTGPKSTRQDNRLHGHKNPLGAIFSIARYSKAELT